MSCWMSSSRLHATRTGPLTCVAMRTAWMTKSTSSRRPNHRRASGPGPRFGQAGDVCGGRLGEGRRVPIQMSQPSLRTCTVQFTGSRWRVPGTAARNRIHLGRGGGHRLVGIGFRATARTRDAASSSRTTSAVVSRVGPSSQRISSAARPCCAAQVSSATTATRRRGGRPDARRRFSPSRRRARHLAAEHRTGGQRGELHPATHVDAEQRGESTLAGVEARRRLADQPKSLGPSASPARHSNRRGTVASSP
jgi:hypothetical protein